MKLTEEAQRLIDERIDATVQAVLAEKGSTPFEVHAPPLPIPDPRDPEWPSPERSAKWLDLHDIRGDDYGFKSFGDFAKVCLRSKGDERLVRTLVETEPSAGGHLVPPEYFAELLDFSMESEIIRPRCKNYTMSSNEKWIPGIKASDRDGAGMPITGTVKENWATPGGDGDEFPSEGVTIPTGDPIIRLIQLKAKRLHLMVEVSNELIEDSKMSIEMIVGDEFKKALSFYIDYRALQGTGAGQPQGMLNCNALYSYNRAVASQIAWADIIGMWGRLAPGSHDNAIWVASQSTIPQLYAVTQATSNWGMWHPLSNAKTLQYLLGRPLYITEKLPSLGVKGDLMLLDPQFYSMGFRSEGYLEADPYGKFDQNLTRFRMIIRMDGQPTIDDSFNTAEGLEVSPFVALDVP